MHLILEKTQNKFSTTELMRQLRRTVCINQKAYYGQILVEQEAVPTERRRGLPHKRNFCGEQQGVIVEHEHQADDC